MNSEWLVIVIRGKGTFLKFMHSVFACGIFKSEWLIINYLWLKSSNYMSKPYRTNNILVFRFLFYSVNLKRKLIMHCSKYSTLCCNALLILIFCILYMNKLSLCISGQISKLELNGVLFSLISIFCQIPGWNLFL